jgi:hypothetical protein
MDLGVRQDAANRAPATSSRRDVGSRTRARGDEEEGIMAYKGGVGGFVYIFLLIFGRIKN